ncbi:alkylated DNA repair protein alkB homolog 8 isoform X2 [Lampris incognitus]|uniref:alkylated DNA repair protein alkB homolog 8 isoform X2 n=1 Tax=Lampris incognitus TaxID=2546036 RepID=UPI0024B5F863|nr:alkylated DNA repair protein alkB homolog 8 isoform X2 [Lampris incognitus]
MDTCVDDVKAVKMSKEAKKRLRKQIKVSHTLLKHEGIPTASQPTKSLVVANGGLGNGVSRERLFAALKEMGELENLAMPPHKPYAFVTYRSEDVAQKAHARLNGLQLQCGENSVTLYLTYVNSVSCESEVGASLPAGLVLVEDFVSPEEEAVLLAAVDWSSMNVDVTAQKALKHRRVKHYGYEFRYDNNNVDKDKPLSAGIPEECVPILQRCMRDGHMGTMPDQLTVNQYQSGQGIPPHVDTHSAFEDTILSLSLGAKTVMEFRHPDGRVAAVVLPGRSLLVMAGESRFLWTHGITPRKFDTVPACNSQTPTLTSSDISNHSNLTLSKRGTRTSFTFRKIRRSPCRCAFPSACDSQGAPSAPTPPPPSLPRCHADAARLEELYVHRVYNTIASHFSSTRHSPWPRVCHFLSSLTPGSVLADVGCGNGKYLGINREVIAVGCDRSSALVQICTERGYQAFVSDALNVPLRTATCDACISIAVIHHFSTQERRLAAVRELVRLLKPGGQALIYVWALEQEYKQKKSKYLKDCSKEHSGSQQLTDSTLERSGVPGGTVSVHTNRTPFNSQDLLVPWHLKEGKAAGVGKAANSGKEKMKGESQMTSDNSSSSAQVSATHSLSPDSKTKFSPGLGSNQDTSPRSDAVQASSPQESKPKSGADGGSNPASVFHRYYHVFQQGELEQLCDQVPGVKVQSSYHDQGNWCVILVKDRETCNEYAHTYYETGI